MNILIELKKKYVKFFSIEKASEIFHRNWKSKYKWTEKDKDNLKKVDFYETSWKRWNVKHYLQNHIYNQCHKNISFIFISLLPKTFFSKNVPHLNKFVLNCLCSIQISKYGQVNLDWKKLISLDLTTALC